MQRRFEGPIGLDGMFRVREANAFEPLLTVKGTWQSDNTFQVIVRSLLEGVVTTYLMTFDGQRIRIALEDNRGVRERIEGETSD